MFQMIIHCTELLLLYIHYCIFHIIYTYLHTGFFHSVFKQSRITPLLKKPTLNQTLLGNYKPDSLLPFIAQTIERIVFNHAFLTQNILLDSNQSGFRSGHSNETALLSVVEALKLAREASESSFLILLDLSAAFDTVNNQILLSPPLSKGISRTGLQGVDSYLSDRSFKVSWRGEVSKSQHVATGVPQGSVPRPHLFSVYMASLGSLIQKHSFSYHCYSDDTQLYLSFHPDDPTITARISACLTDISCWMKDHHLQPNLAEKEVLVVSANPSLHQNFTFQLGSSTITPSKTARNLGAVIDDKLNLSDHIAKTARSCRFALYNIRKIRTFLSEHATQLLVQALVLSRLTILQYSLDRSSCQFHQTSTINPKCRCKINIWWAEKNARHTSVHQFTLATNSCSHKIQGITVCLQNPLWLYTTLPKFSSSALPGSLSNCFHDKEAGGWEWPRTEDWVSEDMTDKIN